MSRLDFERKVTVQAHDTFVPCADLGELSAMIREQKIPGQLIVSYPGNGGIDSVVFHGKAVKHQGEVKEV